MTVFNEPYVTDKIQQFMSNEDSELPSFQTGDEVNIAGIFDENIVRTVEQDVRPHLFDKKHAKWILVDSAL